MTDAEKARKRKAREVLERIDKGESVGTTVLHIIEIENMLKALTDGGLPEAQRVVKTLLVNPSIRIVDVSGGMLRNAFSLAERACVNLADSVGWLVMRDTLKTREVYTFDGDFNKLDPGIVVFP